ncbi:ATP-grasp fold amidoligase family protein [Brachybacterium vulturis]|uniref:ATP-grasp fold amidoligase family protein n=1 Tax=Brachybacterium vulturis TaxID=2017484 RepID=UPI0012FE7550|nr:ATP-grasp fold amidoligase family protein [Brachybacterium vulturis]
MDLLPPIKDDKLVGKRFVEELGFRSARILRQFERIEDIDIEGISEPFVLKPTFSSSNHGVFLLRGTEKSGVFWDDQHQCERSIAEILQVLTQRSESSQYEDKRWIAEERIRGTNDDLVPHDVKFFAFHGQIGLVQLTEHRRPRNRVAFFDGEFRRLPFTPEESGIRVNPAILELHELPLPVHASELIEMAKEISSAMPTPFVRIDLYDTPDGPVFGEFTFTPGTFYYEDREVMSAALSKQLGSLWLQAETSLCDRDRGSHSARELLGVLSAGTPRRQVSVALRTGSFALEDRSAMAPEISAFRGSASDVVRDAMHDVPIRRFTSLSDVEIDTESPARYIVSERHDPLPLDFLVYPRDSDRVLVGLHGAEFRKTADLPKFQFVRSFLTRSESLLFLADSTLLQNDQLNLGWMAGTEGNHLLPRYARVVDLVQDSLAAKQSVLVGHSAGGFMSIAIGSMIAGSIAISVNGQTVLEKYEPWTLRQLRDAVFSGTETVESMIERYRSRLDLREILSNRLEGTRFAYFAHAEDPNTMTRLPMFPALAEYLGVDPSVGGRTEAGDVMSVCRWPTAENVPVHALPGTVLPFIDAVLGQSTSFEFGTTTRLSLV